MERMGRALTATRYLVLVGVVASLVLSAVLFLVVAERTIVVIGEAIAAAESEKAVKLITVACIELVDLSLLASALYIVGLGLFELFIGPAHLPRWLVIASLDDLKARLISVVVVILGVSFLGQIATWDGTTNLLPLGVAIAAVILALAAFGALHIGSDSHTASGATSSEDAAHPDRVAPEGDRRSTPHTSQPAHARDA